MTICNLRIYVDVKFTYELTPSNSVSYLGHFFTDPNAIRSNKICIRLQILLITNILFLSFLKNWPKHVKFQSQNERSENESTAKKGRENSYTE